MQQFKKFSEKIETIKMFALDVDGVLTNGDLVYTSNGEFIKVFNVKDGLGLKLLQDKGFIVAIISSRKSDVVTYRMKELGIKFVFQGVEDKYQLIEDLTGQFMLYWNNIAFMGDDLIDVPVLQKAGFSACPPDAVEEVISLCDYVTQREAGRGAVREVANLILKSRNN
jgi:3-deoxy-D-manno-octulosonate 8-phosphate phosphatase (KDO 8-P phosphatase)